MRSSLFIAATLLTASLAAHADTIVTQSLTGTFQSGSTLSGLIVIDNTTGTVVSGNLAVTNKGLVDTFTTFTDQYTATGSYIFNFADSVGTDLALVVAGTSIMSGASLCTSAAKCPDGSSSALEFTSGFNDFLSTTSVSSVTPEPSTLLLLGTGLLGGAGTCLRRLRASRAA